MSWQFDLVCGLWVVDRDHAILLGVGESFGVGTPLDNHDPVVSLYFFKGSLCEDIPKTDSAVAGA